MGALPSLWFVVLICAVSPGGVSGAQPQRELKPAWLHEFAVGIEWAEAVGGKLLVATSDRRLHLLRGEDGEAEWPEPVKTNPGVRLVQGYGSKKLPARRVWAFDRQAIYALDVGGGDPVVWRYGPLKDPRAFLHDPEALTGWLAVAATPRGILGLNRSGRGVMFSHADGEPVWEWQGPIVGMARLHAMDDTVVWLSRQAGRTHATWIELDTVGLQLREKTYPCAWPIWSALTSHGLLAATVDVLSLCRPDGMLQTVSVPTDGLWATRLAVHRRVKDGDRGVVVVVADDAHIYALDVGAGELVWRQQVSSRVGRIGWVEVYKTYVMVTGTQATSVFNVGTGDCVATCELAAGRRRLGSHVTETGMWVVDVAEGAVNELRLAMLEWRWLTATRPVREGEARLRFAGVREVHWMDGQVVLVAPKSIVAYTLPRGTQRIEDD